MKNWFYALIFILLTSCTNKAYLVSRIDPTGKLNTSTANKKIKIEYPVPTYIEDKELGLSIQKSLSSMGFTLVEKESDAEGVLRFRRTVQVGSNLTYVPQLVTQQSQGVFNGKPFANTQTAWVSTPQVYRYSITNLSLAIFPVEKNIVLNETVWEAVLSAKSNDFVKNSDFLIGSMIHKMGQNYEGQVKIK